MPDTRRSLSALQTLYADNTAGDISAQDGRDELISSHPEKTSQSDTQANEPSSGQLTGDMFLPNNGCHIERYSGSAWQPWGPIFPFTKPVDGDFAWINQGSATVSTTNGGITLNSPSNGSAHNLRIRKKAAPSTPYTITAAFLCSWNTTGSALFHYSGLCFRQSSDGKVHSLNFHAVTGTAGAWYNQSNKWASSSSFSASYVDRVGPLIPGGVIWMRIADNGTNRICSVSANGQNWITVDTIGRTDFLTADEVGFFVNPYNTETNLHLLHWAQA